MRVFLRQTVAVFVLLAFSVQTLGAESLALIASPNAARQLMPPPAAQVPPPKPASFIKAPPKIEPPAEWGYYVLAAGEIAAESFASGRRSIEGQWSALTFKSESLSRDAAIVAAELQDGARAALRELSNGLSFGVPEKPEAIAPIDLPRPMPSVLTRVAVPRPEPEPVPADVPQQDRIMVMRTMRAQPAAFPSPARDRIAPIPSRAIPLQTRTESPLEIRSDDFSRKVLESATPVLVMFDTLRNCHCAELELLQLKAQWGGNPAVVSLNAEDSPELARRYGVQSHATLLLFSGGNLLKKGDAWDMEQRVKARHGGHFDSADMKGEIERFANPGHTIKLYSAKWCPHCQDAKRWLEARGLPFEYLDIDKDPKAMAEYRANYNHGIPVAVIDGTPITGFIPERYSSLLER